jgi:hypothetical protein
VVVACGTRGGGQWRGGGRRCGPAPTHELLHGIIDHGDGDGNSTKAGLDLDLTILVLGSRFFLKFSKLIFRAG